MHLLFLLLPAFADIPPSPPASPPKAASLLFPQTEAKTASGLVVSVDLRDEYLAGFPMLVTVTVRNDSEAVRSFPDLSARPFLAHFLLNSSKGYKQDRFNTPPPADPGTTWTIAPHAQRQVLLELPSSSTLAAGEWDLSLELRDPGGTIGFPTHHFRLAAPAPVASDDWFDPVVSATAGSAMVWVHQAKTGFDVYLSTFGATHPERMQGPYAVLHSREKIAPRLSRTRPGDANARYLYWLSGSTLSLVRLDSYTARSEPRTIALPYPSVELLAAGVTNGKGGFQVPLWIPSPKGTGGSVKVLEVGVKGEMTLRVVTDLPERPRRVQVGVDAGGILLFAITHAAGLDLYRVDAGWAPELPAKGQRLWKAETDTQVDALAWDVLPDQPDRPGGLALEAFLVTRKPEGNSYRRLHLDFSGKTLSDSGLLPWKQPGTVEGFLSGGTTAFYVMSRDEKGVWWYSASGGAPQKIGEGGTLWQDKAGIHLRRVKGTVVVENVLLGG